MTRWRCGAMPGGGMSLPAGVTRTLLQVAAPASQRLALYRDPLAFVRVRR